MTLEASPIDSRRTAVNRASLLDTLRFIKGVVLPTFGKGILIRRPTMEAAAQRLGFDTGAVKTMQRLRRTYGSAPLHFAIPWRPQLVLFAPADAMEVLNATPRPFATDTKEKRAALNHFEPGNVLIATPSRRAVLRPLHEFALDTSHIVHPAVARFRAVIADEFERVLQPELAELDWPTFAAAWFRAVRRISLGDRARDDNALTEQLNRLRRRANWAFFLPTARAERQSFLDTLATYLEAAEPDSLAGRMTRDDRRDPTAQIAQWLFAFDAAGMATFRTLALLASHPQHARRACEEALQERAIGSARESFTRRCCLESLRLWPTTPVILRQATGDLAWDGRPIAKDMGVLIFTPFFARDDETLGFANKMAPEVWENAHSDMLPDLGIVPFSGGPAICPAHNLVPLLACLTISAVLQQTKISPISPVLDPNHLPGTLNHFEIRLGLAGRA